MVLMSARAVNRATLARQMLVERADVSGVEAVGRLVGMQGQEPKHPYVGLWSRLDGFEEAELDRAVAERDVVRATLFRGTLHLVTAADYLRFRTTVSPVLEAGLKVLGRGAGGGDGGVGGEEVARLGAVDVHRGAGCAAAAVPRGERARARVLHTDAGAVGGIWRRWTRCHD